MTTYVLIGGYDSKMTAAWRKKLRGVVSEKLDDEKPRILSVPFATPREYWEIRFRDWRVPDLDKTFGKKYDVRSAQPDTFLDDCAWANVIYLHGGDYVLLAYYLDKFSDLREMFMGKVVIGSSAGTEYLSKIFWTPDWRKVMTGAGFVNVAAIPHFGSSYTDDGVRKPINWEIAEKELRATTKLPVYLLREGEFEVFEVEP